MLIIQILTIALMFGLTFVVYRALGPPKRGLLYTREEKAKWDFFIQNHSLGGILTIVNVVGTLTSLAGAYVFLMGNAKLFGYFILMCSVTLIPGALITKKFSDRIMSSERLKALLDSPNQTGGVIAALFWGDDINSKRTAQLVKWTSILYLCAILWLEFTVFAAVGESLLGLHSIYVAPVLLFVCSFAVALFTLTYGVRGFVFADLFHVPLVLLAALAILGGCLVLSYHNWNSLPPIREIMLPKLTLWPCVLFAVANVILNGLQILTTENQWLRYWIFRERATGKLTVSTMYTGLLWAFLSAVGLLAYYFSGNNVGTAAVSGLLVKLSTLSVLFFAVFWVGGIAALFSTADSTLYSFLVAWNFSPKDGVLHDRKMASIHPLYTAVIFAILVTIVYAVLLRWLGLSIDKLVYVIYYLPLNLFPAFVRAYRRLPQSPWYIVGSLVFFFAAEIAGLLQAELSLEWTLAATVVPIIVGIIAAIGTPPAIVEQTSKPVGAEA